MTVIRCSWVNEDPLYMDYHDLEWGVPVHDDRHLFEMITLEGAQAGLSWYTVLKKREAYRAAFDQFNVNVVAQYDEERIMELLANPGIVRNKLKVRSTVTNAQAFIRIQEEFGTFDQYIWGFINGVPIDNRPEKMTDVPVSTPLSDQISKDLKRRGFSFVGTTIIYSFMQAIGMINDHIQTCCCRVKHTIQ
ncbi:DNA-3-methyladenine glycosylase I [Paenibacillus sp. N1-5-1-14]|nr:DNA-3-methyladenine glycosylase I [Paenibacillus radicibacter]MCR8642071.1 DNA-3-methyladenine glycosylase I [Paenibacillus radicibacter]